MWDSKRISWVIISFSLSVYLLILRFKWLIYHCILPWCYFSTSTFDIIVEHFIVKIKHIRRVNSDTHRRIKWILGFTTSWCHCCWIYLSPEQIKLSIFLEQTLRTRVQMRSTHQQLRPQPLQSLRRRRYVVVQQLRQRCWMVHRLVLLLLF